MIITFIFVIEWKNFSISSKIMHCGIKQKIDLPTHICMLGTHEHEQEHKHVRATDYMRSRTY